MIIRYIICLLSIALFITNCSGQNNSKEKDSIIFSQQPTKRIQRFDKDFHNYLSNPSLENQKSLKSQYDKFLPAFGRITINSSDSYKNEFFSRLQKYFSNEMLSQIYLDALNTFENIDDYERELSAANELITIHFNGKQLPSLFMHVSGFKENVMVLENIISISTDKYLGAEYPLYKRFFEKYQLIQMQPKMVTRDYLKAWLLSEIINEKKNKNLLDEMIEAGKVLHSLSVLLPDWPTYDLIGYTPEQEQWCIDNEKKIWQTIVQLNHLYEQDYLLINKYINDAPYTANLTSESPGRTGAWVGWQIVNTYLSKNKTSLSDLLLLDSQSILKESGYKP